MKFRISDAAIVAILIVAAPLAPSSAEDAPRARDLGIPFVGVPGSLNAITDVAGVEVGHVTLFSGSGSLEVVVTKPYAESTLSRIIHLIEEAQSQKAPTQRFIDVFSYYYTPAVIIIACLIVLLPPLAFGASFQEWFYRGLILLVISCPCALVISTPVSLVS